MDWRRHHRKWRCNGNGEKEIGGKATENEGLVWWFVDEGSGEREYMGVGDEVGGDGVVVIGDGGV